MKDEDFLKKIGKTIAYFRKEKKLTQADLCALINMEIPNLSAIENGRQNASCLTLKRIADALEIKVNLFFSNI